MGWATPVVAGDAVDVAEDDGLVAPPGLDEGVAVPDAVEPEVLLDELADDDGEVLVEDPLDELLAVEVAVAPDVAEVEAVDDVAAPVGPEVVEVPVVGPVVVVGVVPALGSTQAGSLRRMARICRSYSLSLPCSSLSGTPSMSAPNAEIWAHSASSSAALWALSGPERVTTSCVASAWVTHWTQL